MSARRLVIISAGVGQPSATRLLADQLVAAAERVLRERGVEPSSSVIELRDHARDLTNNLLTGFPGGGLRAVLDAVRAADGLIAVTPIFNASYSGLFKLFFDVLDDDSLVGKPVLMAATGGTARHSLALEYALRPMFAYLRAAAVPTGVFAAAEDWGAAGANGGLRERIDRAAGELAAAVNARQPVGPADPFDDPPPFADLLAGD